MFNTNIEVHGLEEVLRDLELTSEQIDEGLEEIVKEVATEILDEAVENVNGPDARNLVNVGQPYPVGVQTGNLKRSLKIKILPDGRCKVFADMNIAKYAVKIYAALHSNVYRIIGQNRWILRDI